MERWASGIPTDYSSLFEASPLIQFISRTMLAENVEDKRFVKPSSLTNVWN
jgi:hypothetical protein